MIVTLQRDPQSPCPGKLFFIFSRKAAQKQKDETLPYELSIEISITPSHS